MSATVIQLFPNATPAPVITPRKSVYAISWRSETGQQMCVTSTDPDQVARQLVRLADRRIPATVLTGGALAGSVGINADGGMNIFFTP